MMSKKWSVSVTVSVPFYISSLVFSFYSCKQTVSENSESLSVFN